MNKWIVGLLILAAVPFSARTQTVIHGAADLSDYDTQRDGLVYLYGGWEFYWNALLTPDQITPSTPFHYVDVPGSWHRQGDYSLLGYATYRCKFKLPKEFNGLSIYCPVINSASKIWLNGKLVGSGGLVGTDGEHYRGALKGILFSIPDNSADNELVIQVANYSYFSSGFPRTPIIDQTSEILANINRTNGVENFFAGCLIAMCIYQLILYFLYARGKPYLWLALICLGVALRALIVHGGSFLLPNLYPDVPWEVWKKLEFGSVYGITALFPLYVYHLFIDHSPKRPLYFFVVIGCMLLISVIVTPQYFYGKLLDVAHLMLLLGFIYAFYSIAKAWRAGNHDARIILVGVFASFPFILLEIFQNSILIQANIQLDYLVEIGVLVFLVFQIYLLANHYAESYQNLERIVDERTGQLVTANTVKDRLLSVVSHDIKSPLNSLRGILQIYNSGAIQKEEFDHFARSLEDDLNKTSMLVENILYWTAGQLKGVQMKAERFDLFFLVEDNIRLFQTIANHKKISLRHNVEKHFYIHTDRNILNLVLRNLLSNAIKFSFEGSAVEISVLRDERQVTIGVKDEGTGMDPETLRTLVDTEKTVTETGTGDEKGTGLGISLCKEYLRQAGGKLAIESEPGKGSKFIIILPA